MPAPVKMSVNSKSYTCPILNEEMDQIAVQIESCKAEIASLNSHLNDNLTILNNLNTQLLAMYIQQTGSFPN